MRIDYKETKKTGWHEDIQMDTKIKKKFKRPTLSPVNVGPPDRVSVLSTKCGGCHLKRLIVATSHKIKQIMMIIIVIIIIMTIITLTLIFQNGFSVLLDKNKNQLKLLFFPLVPPNMSGIKHFDTDVWAFLSSSPQLKFAYKCWVI